MRGKLFKFKWLLIGGALSTAAAAIWVVFFYRPQPNLPPPPEPNGHDFFLKAGKAILQEPSEIGARSIPPTNSLAELRLLVTTNSEALRLVEEGLQHESRAPMSEYDDEDMSVMMGLMAIRSLAYILCAKAAVMRMDGETNKAADVALDAALLGIRAAEGGPMIDFLVGSAAVQNGLDTLKLSIGGLTVSQCREVRLKLDRAAAEIDTPDEVVQSERDWNQFNFGVKGAIELMWEYETFRPFEEFQSNMQERYDELILQVLEIRILLAAQQFRLEKRRDPEGIDALTPDYLRSIPVDPVTGKLMTLPK